MADEPSFFVPGVNADDAEATYADFATRFGRQVPGPDRRIYSITYVHNQEEWVAIVGQRLRGTGTRKARRGGRRIEQALSDPATVLAIFGGTPFLVVTDYRFVEGVRSAWENPFMADKPTSISYFPVS